MAVDGRWAGLKYYRNGHPEIYTHNFSRTKTH